MVDSPKVSRSEQPELHRGRPGITRGSRRDRRSSAKGQRRIISRFAYRLTAARGSGSSPRTGTVAARLRSNGVPKLNSSSRITVSSSPLRPFERQTSSRSRTRVGLRPGRKAMRSDPSPSRTIVGSDVCGATRRQLTGSQRPSDPRLQRERPESQAPPARAHGKQQVVAAGIAARGRRTRGPIPGGESVSSRRTIHDVTVRPS